MYRQLLIQGWRRCDVLGCSPVRNFSHLSIETPRGNSQYPALSEGDSGLSRCRESSTTSSYKEFLTQVTNVLNSNIKGGNSSVGQIVSQGKWQKYSELQHDTSNISNKERRLMFKSECCDTRVNSSWSNADTIQEYDVDGKNLITCASQTELKCNAETTVNCSGDPNGNEPEKTKPDQQDLERVKDYYIEEIPYLYKRNIDMSQNLHHKDIVFQNNYFEQPKRLRGIKSYCNEQSWLRMRATFRYPTYFFQTVGATTHLDEGCVKLHWRFYYISNWEYFTSFIIKRTKGAALLESLNSSDGISTFSLNKDGLIVKHQVDRLLPIQKAEANNLRPKINSRLVTAFGLAPSPKTTYESNNFRKKTL